MGIAADIEPKIGAAWRRHPATEGKNSISTPRYVGPPAARAAQRSSSPWLRQPLLSLLSSSFSVELHSCF